MISAPNTMTAYLDQLSQGAVLIIGDIMLDHYLIGDVERISPEAPVPVVNITKEELFLGGAGNVAQNITALGGKAHLVGVRGVDAAGENLLHELEARGITSALIPLETRPTTQKTRVLARRQQMLRFDRETAAPFTPAENEQILSAVEQALPQSGAIIISDYGKGLVSPGLMQGIHRLIQESGRQIPILVDPKPQNIGLYEHVTLLTPNTKETGEAAAMPTRNREEILAAGKAIIARLHCPHLITTLGADGMAVFVDENTVWHIPTTAQNVFDVTGAGDTVIATTALCLSAGVPLIDACILANIAAGIVVGQVGTATAGREEIARALSQFDQLSPTRWV